MPSKGPLGKPKPLQARRLANQLGEFNPDLKHTLEPLKPLLSSKNAYGWNPELQKAFDKSKEVLCWDQVLKRFNPARHTVLITDTTRTGLRYVIVQTDKKLEIDASTRTKTKNTPTGTKAPVP